jgi:SAM-dependent methyltransferase
MRDGVANRIIADKESKTGKLIAGVKPEKDFEVVVDKDASLGYETKRWLYLLSLPFLWILTIWVMLKKSILAFFGVKPRINTFWVEGLSPLARKIKEGAGSWRALDIAYNFVPGRENGFRGKATDYWLRVLNGQAVRNRLRLVKRELLQAVREVGHDGKEVQLFSVASGSAQGVLEVIQMAKKEGIKVHAVLLDLDRTALDYGKKLAKKYGVEDQIECVKKSTYNLEDVIDGFRPHIVEMIGFLDYRPHDKAALLIRRIHNFLRPGGKLLTSNICPNPEKAMLKWLFDWPMIYRRPEELGQLIVEGGFPSFRCRLVCEPLQIYTLAICQKIA